MIKHDDHIGCLAEEESKHTTEKDGLISHSFNHDYKSCNDHEKVHLVKKSNSVTYIIFGIMIFLTGSFMIVEFVIGTIIKSLALQADAFHMLSDVIALIIALYSTIITDKKRTHDATFGYTRAEIIGAFANTIFLISSCFFICLESIQRFINISEVEQSLSNDIDLLLITAGIGMGINIFGIIIFTASGNHGHGHDHGHSHGHNLNIMGVLLHIIGDLLGSLGVLVSGLIIKYITFESRFYADPVASLLIVIIILFTSIPLTKKCINILMHIVPNNINLKSLQEKLLNINGIKNIHHLHVWQHNDNIVIGTLHIVVDIESDIKIILQEVEELLHKSKIHTTTIQTECFDETGMCSNIICTSSKCKDNICCDDI